MTSRQTPRADLSHQPNEKMISLWPASRKFNTFWRRIKTICLSVAVRIEPMVHFSVVGRPYRRKNTGVLVLTSATCHSMTWGNWTRHGNFLPDENTRAGFCRVKEVYLVFFCVICFPSLIITLYSQLSGLGPLCCHLISLTHETSVRDASVG